MRTDLANGVDMRQTYEEYLETMKAYHFYPLKRDQWERLQVGLHGCYKPSLI